MNEHAGPSAYPVRLEGDLPPDLSRWLWLVKWLLVIPHIFVLAVLWVVFTVLTILAFFAILLTGHYPRSMFDVNVGVLRWWWRVAFYSYNALGTDRYPPFTMLDVPDYPARLDVEYPGEMSRGLALIKWWLLALPQYLVVAVFVGAAGIGLVGLLVLAAGFGLLFTGRYPQGIFDLVMGMNRWIFRVTVYAGLMTDVYPPFRLDSGAHEPPPAPAADSAGPEIAPA